MTNYEQQQQLKQKQQQQQQQVQAYYQIYPHPPNRSLSTTKPTMPYERASFDPLTDLATPANQPFSTIPTRRRHQPTVNNVSIVHL